MQFTWKPCTQASWDSQSYRDMLGTLFISIQDFVTISQLSLLIGEYFSFYPNGGLSQPDCKMDIVGYCSHQHAYKYFAKSINTPIHGFLCNSLEDAKTGKNCSKDHTALLGGEPGSFNQ